MALNSTALDLMGDALADVALFLSLHTATPDGSGSSESTAGRMGVAWNPSTGGVVTATGPVEFTGGATSGPVATQAGLWSAPTGGTFYGTATITGDSTFSSTGEYTVTSVTITGSSA